MAAAEPGTGPPGPADLQRRSPQQLADPLTRNGYSLIANSGATAGALGLVYWLLMARLYPTADVGRASAVYAAMNLLAGFTAQNFNGALNRFIPQAGLRTRTLRHPRLCGERGGVGRDVDLFLLTVQLVGSSYSELNGPVIGAVFVACVAAGPSSPCRTVSWSACAARPGCWWRMALRRRQDRPVGAAGGGAARHLGIYVSWMLPALVAIPLVNVLIFGTPGATAHPC